MMPAIWAYLGAHGLELAGMITTVLGIWLATRRLLICWPVSLLADVLYLIVFYQSRLYSDALLQIFFVAFTFYGWWHWWRGVLEEGTVRIAPLGLRGWTGGMIAGAIGAVLLGALMVRVGAALPYLDATLASYSLVASWWQARKHLANWWLWIVIDLIYIGEYLYKDLQATALLYAGLVLLAALGLRDWRRAQTPQMAV
ncbi:MAG TPA: nicotinamide riboside transporter PnuC [Terracidiphilus sp.]|jgi:nicotinamide mononucleotide transporter|nr:nicotinamide riboside transporter PnuC [Terracidiphilus sp.]